VGCVCAASAVLGQTRMCRGDVGGQFEQKLKYQSPKIREVMQKTNNKIVLPICLMLHEF